MKKNAWIITLILALMILMFGLLLRRPGKHGASRSETRAPTDRIDAQYSPRIYIQ